ncbi:MAG: PAS domain-containing sensor histidine kinase [Candidatus Berkiella sp.]
MCTQTVLKQTSQLALAHIEQWLASFPVGVIVIDTQGSIIYANSMAHELLTFDPTYEKWSDVLQKNIKATCDNGHYLQSLSNKYLVLKTQSLPQHQGQLILLVDESEIKQNNETSLQMEKINSIGKLSATLAHQLRTPLSTAYLYASNLELETVSKDEVKYYQGKIIEQLDNIKQQLDNVLLVHKGSEALCEKINIIHEVTALCDNYKILYPHITVKINTKSKASHIIANKSALNGAFSNIIENAIQASAKGKLVSININENDSNVVIEVVDSGCGISPLNIEKVLSGFFTTKKDGNGLGLVIAKNIIEAHRGELMITSEVGSFTKISISLPRIKE